jgi:hypothetical protein
MGAISSRLVGDDDEHFFYETSEFIARASAGEL